jgi:hypothetical protein
MRMTDNMKNRIVIVSGGQTGADQGGFRAANALGLRRRGFAPKNWTTETGVVPSVFRLGMVEHPDYNMLGRTHANIAISDLTLVFYQRTLTSGSERTLQRAQATERPVRAIDLSVSALELKAAQEAIQRALVRLLADATLRRGEATRNAPGAQQDPYIGPALVEWAALRADVQPAPDAMWLHIAGSRESISPGIGERVRDFLTSALWPLLSDEKTLGRKLCDGA